MLALTGRRADGWLPSLAYLQPGDLATGNAVIDESAQEAGRSPHDARRLLDIVGHFTAASRGPLHDVRRIAGEVAPAVRELVDSERTPAPGKPRNTR